MKRFLGALLALLSSPAVAMDAADIPGKFGIPWGNSAGSSYIRVIPEASQIGIQNCAASLTDGFPPLTFVPSNAGGCPPFGQDFNGILRQITQWSRWQAAGAPTFFDSAFASSISGYPAGTILTSTTPGNFWLNTVDANSSNPDSGGSNWLPFSPVNRYAVDSGSANLLSVTLAPAPISLAQLVGIPINVKVAATNTSTTPTLVVNGFTAKTIVNPDGSAVQAKQLAAGQIATFNYDGTNYQLISTSNQTNPTFIKITSGSGTQAIPTLAKQLRVKMVGGGGGGGGNGNSTGGIGGNGGTTTFAAGAITAIGGNGGGTNSSTTGGSGSNGGTGGVTGGGATEILRTPGGPGGTGSSTIPSGNFALAGSGGTSCFGAGTGGSFTTPIGSGSPGSGGAGNGAAASANIAAGGGGAAGECVEFIIDSPATSYTYAVGAAGTSGSSGSGGGSGAPGAAGLILIEVRY